MQYILTSSTLTVVIDGKPRSLHRGKCGEITWDKAMEALKAGDIVTLEKFIDTGNAVNKHFAGSPIRIDNGVLYHYDEELDIYPARKAVEFVRQDLPHEPLIRFLERIEHNPIYRARRETYGFLEANNMPLTPEGKFFAYKKVQRRAIDGAGETGLFDIHSGTMNNNPGVTVSMTRNKVDENPERTCSHGLHVCSYQYLPSFGCGHWDTVVAVEVDPADVVAVPHDYHNAKMRVCRYRVLEEIEYSGGEGQHYWGDRAVVDDYVLESSEEGDLNYPEEAEDVELDTEVDEVQNKIQELFANGDRVSVILRTWLRDQGHETPAIITVREMIRDLIHLEERSRGEIITRIDYYY